MRPEETIARGIRMNMKTAVRTANRICMRYCRNAVRLPIDRSPLSTRAAPNHITATVERLRISVIVGIVMAKRRVTRSWVWKRSRLATSKRSSSCSVRTKARITRIPDSVSRMTWLIRSIFTWTARKSGIARVITSPITSAMSGITTSRRPDSGTSVRRAMMMPPMIRIGAEIMIVRDIRTTVWTWRTSLVLRVISEAGPKWLTSTWLNVSTLLKIALRTSRPKPIAMRALR